MKSTICHMTQKEESIKWHQALDLLKLLKINPVKTFLTPLLLGRRLNRCSWNGKCKWQNKFRKTKRQASPLIEVTRLQPMAASTSCCTTEDWPITRGLGVRTMKHTKVVPMRRVLGHPRWLLSSWDALLLTTIHWGEASNVSSSRLYTFMFLHTHKCSNTFKTLHVPPVVGQNLRKCVSV